MLSDNEKLMALVELGKELNDVQDLDILMERVLTEARRFASADAGSIYILEEDDHLRFAYTQNQTLQGRLRPGQKLIYNSFRLPVNHNSIAGYVASTGELLNIADVYEIGDSYPFSFSRAFDEKAHYRTRSMLTLPLRSSRGDMIGVLQIINKQSPDDGVGHFDATDEQIMQLFASIAVVGLERARMTRAILMRMIRLAEMRDPKETGAHVNRVAAISVELYEAWARRRDLPERQIQRSRDILRMAAMLHDVGKVAIPDAILKKPGKLTDEEFDEIKTHTWRAAVLFGDRQSELDDAAAEVALSHHEKWNGRGYPGWVDYATGMPLPDCDTGNGKARGKCGEEIPVFGRIVALADVYDALTSARAYKEAWDEDKVNSILREEAGEHFDPELIEIFFDNLANMQAIMARYQ